MITISTENLLSTVKQALLNCNKSSFDPELLSESPAILNVYWKIQEKDIWFSIKNKSFYYNYNFSDYFPFINPQIITHEILHRNSVFLESWKIQNLISHLQKYPFSRRAIINIWNNKYYELDKPWVCITHLYFRISEWGLAMHTHARANNAYKMLFLDLQAMMCIQYYIASALQIKIWDYYHYIDSLQLYKEESEDIQKQVDYINTSHYRSFIH